MESLDSRGACVRFSDLVDEYVQQWTGKSFQAQQGRAACWRSVLGHRVLSDIATNHIRQAIKNLEKGYAMRSDGRGKSRGRLKATAKKRSPSTSNRYRSTLSAIFRYAMIERYLPVNPVSRVPSRKVNNLRNRYLSEIECSRLLSAYKENHWPRLYLAVLMAMTTGMRKFELFGLRWCDIDFERGLAMLADTNVAYAAIKNGVKTNIILIPNHPSSFEIKEKWRE